MSDAHPQELSDVDARARLKELVEDIDFTMLTTQDAAGHLVSRPMSTRTMDASGDIWFFTLEDSKKVDEAERDHDVNLAYVDAKGHRYVTVSGTARTVDDRALMEKLYTPALDIWFEDGLATPQLTLLKVTPVQAEFWEPRHGRLVHAAGMLKALVTRDAPDETMRHGSVRFRA